MATLKTDKTPEMLEFEHATAQLRHLYVQLMAGDDRNRRLARGLLAPQIRIFERLAAVANWHSAPAQN